MLLAPTNCEQYFNQQLNLSLCLSGSCSNITTPPTRAIFLWLLFLIWWQCTTCLNTNKPVYNSSSLSTFHNTSIVVSIVVCVCVCCASTLFHFSHCSSRLCVFFFSLHFIFLILVMFAIQFSLLLLVLYLCLPCISWMSLLLLLGSECNKTKWKCSKLCVLCRLNR